MNISEREREKERERERDLRSDNIDLQGFSRGIKWVGYGAAAGILH